MTSSSKKKKGKQRKAAKSQAMVNYGVSSSRELAAKVEAEAKFVEEVGRGRGLQTKGLSVVRYESKLDPNIVWYD